MVESARTARIRLPNVADAPGIRDFIRGAAEFEMREMVEGWGLVAPREGAAAVRDYLTAYRLCDAATTIDDETWAPIITHPPLEGPEERRTRPGGEPTPEWSAELIRHADKVYERGAARGVAGADLAAVSATMAALRLDDLPGYLTRQCQTGCDGNAARWSPTPSTSACAARRNAGSSPSNTSQA